MPKIKKLAIFATILVIIGFVGALLTFPQIKETEILTEEVLLENEDIHSIEVFSNNAKVNIVPTSDTHGKVVFESSNYGVEDNFDAAVENGTLKVNSSEKQKKFIRFHSLNKSLNISIYLPQKEYKSMNLNVVNGKVQAEDLIVNHINIETVNGKIDVSNIESSITLFSPNGAINLENIKGDLQGKTINSKINVKTDHLDRSIELESVNGSIEIITIEEPTNATIRANVLRGRTEIFGDSTESIVFGEGQHRIDLSTINGKIVVTY